MRLHLLAGISFPLKIMTESTEEKRYIVTGENMYLECDMYYSYASSIMNRNLDSTNFQLCIPKRDSW